MNYDVREFGAKGDAIQLDTQSIQKAIDVCHQEGGGCVVLERGVYLTGTLYMKSNVTLSIATEAVLLGSDRIEDYTQDTHKQMYRKETHMDRCLIYSKDVSNLTITGGGTICGQGEKFKGSRPMLFRFVGCHDIRISDVKMKSPASWTNAFIDCESIWVDRIAIESRANNNGDGLDFDGCRNVFVANSQFDCSDDCICLQNSFVDKICEHITITNCLFKSQWAGMRIGLLSSGIIQNVVVSNCLFRDIACSGLKIQSSEGSLLRQMTFSNLVMENVQRPLFVTLNHYRENVDLPENITTPSRLENLMFSHILATGVAKENHLPVCMIIDSESNHVIKDISLSHITYQVRNVQKEKSEVRDIPGHIGKRAEAFNYKGDLPACGLYARNVEGLQVTHMEIKTQQGEQREKMYCENCQEI